MGESEREEGKAIHDFLKSFEKDQQILNELLVWNDQGGQESEDEESDKEESVSHPAGWNVMIEKSSDDEEEEDEQGSHSNEKCQVVSRDDEHLEISDGHAVSLSITKAMFQQWEASLQPQHHEAKPESADTSQEPTSLM
eukprot:scaffold1420_cov182-Ochromonas_danica.AAC.14